MGGVEIYELRDDNGELVGYEVNCWGTKTTVAADFGQVLLAIEEAWKALNIKPAKTPLNLPGPKPF